MVGAEAPAVRAGLMAAMMLLGQFFGREGNQGRFLLFAVMIMLLISPLILFDIGFQLSFAATAGIIWLYPILRNKTFCSSSENFDSVSDSLANKRTLSNKVFGARKVKPHKICWTRHVLMKIFSFPLLGEAFLVTVSAQLITLPILLVNFGQFSWLSPLANSLVLPTIPIIMALGLFLAGLSFISKFTSQVLAWFVWPFLTWFVKIVDWFGQLPIGNWEVGKIGYPIF
jgi:competence protein ComEC